MPPAFSAGERLSVGEEKRDRQKDNCGWDLEYMQAGRSLCVEVKGLSGAALGVELSPNEYAAMKRAMSDGTHILGDGSWSRENADSGSGTARIEAEAAGGPF